MDLGVVIPTLNEEQYLPRILTFLKQHLANDQIVVVDGGSADDTNKIARQFDVHLIKSHIASRAVQMNLGANYLDQKDVLYFVHCDTMPPTSFFLFIDLAIDDGAELGAYRLKFDQCKGLMHVNAYLTRYPALCCRGGDQSLFVKRRVFDQLCGFDESKVIMEDFDFIKRAKKLFKFHVIQKDITVSSRKYQKNSYWRVQFANVLIYTLFKFGFRPNLLKSWYSRLLR